MKLLLNFNTFMGKMSYQERGILHFELNDLVFCQSICSLVGIQSQIYMRQARLFVSSDLIMLWQTSLIRYHEFLIKQNFPDVS